MKIFWFTIARSRAENPLQQSAQEKCKAVGDALGKGRIGDTVTAIQGLILQYYSDVRGQAGESFKSAQTVALFGFILLASTVVYVIVMDIMSHFSTHFITRSGGMGVGSIGLIGGSVVELIAGVQFVLYGRATKQFGAFHICLERTHRYLLAYEMADQIKGRKDETLEKIVCIMANAPMITLGDIEGASSGAVGHPNSIEHERLAIPPQEQAQPILP